MLTAVSKTAFIAALLLRYSSQAPFASIGDNEALQESRDQDKNTSATSSLHRATFLHSAHCRYLSAERCQSDDEDHAKYIEFVGRKHRERKAKHRALNPSLPHDSTDTFRVPVLLVRFANHVGEEWNLPTREYFETLFNGEDGAGPNEVGSIASYLHFASLGAYNVAFDVFDWRTTDNTEAFFANGTRGLVGNQALQAMFTPVLDQLEQEGIDWHIYDISGGQPREGAHPEPVDLILDHMLVIHSGYGGELGNREGCDPPLPDVQGRIWSQGSGSLGNPWTSARTGHRLGGYSVGSAFGLPVCGAEPSKMAVITHEFLHGFKLLDLYDLDTNDESYNGGGGIGSFGIMADLVGFGRNLAVPGHLSPASRYDAEWLDFIDITQDGIYAAQASEVSSDVYRIQAGYATGEYILIENRQRLFWDQEMPTSGIVIWHVDENKPRQNERGYPGHPGWPLEHYRVAVIQADGLFELEQNINRGQASDFWRTKGMVLGPGPDTQPNTDSYYNGPTGVQISILSDPSYIMLFQVSGLGSVTAEALHPT